MNAAPTSGAPLPSAYRRSGLDLLLSFLTSSLAIYSLGRALGAVDTGYLSIGIILVGGLFSFAMQRLLKNSPALRVDGFLYGSIYALILVYFRGLLPLFPDDVFGGQLRVAGLLLLLILGGSFFTWREATLLFQAVPSLALFGLVGCYDTYTDATFLFFAYLLGIAILCSRSHLRTMYDFAKGSGYRRLPQLQEGPWRWMAGPGWAVGSATVVIIVSLISAPLVRESTKSVTQAVSVDVTPFQSALQQASTAAASVPGRSDLPSVQVGQGPRNALSNQEVFRATIGPEPRYLRGYTYSLYSRRGWQRNPEGQDRILNGERANRRRSAREEMLMTMRGLQEHNFKIELVTSRVSSLPLPAEPIMIEGGGSLRERGDGTWGFDNTEPSMRPYTGIFVVPDPSLVPRDAGRVPAAFEDTLDIANTPPSVVSLARESVQSAQTDYEKALAIKAEIESRVVYNLKAPATPAGKDAVEYCLFESKEGYCDLFASAMALMARSVGIPSRYVTGYYPIHEERDGETFILREKEAHAWAELYFRDVGWVVFDPTEGANEMPGNERGSTDGRLSNYLTLQMLRRLIDWALAAAVAFALIYGVYTFWSARRSRTVRHLQLGKEYRLFVNGMERFSGKRRRLSQTPDEYLAGISGALGAHLPLAQTINRRFVEALYSSETLQPDEVGELRRSIYTLRRALRSQKGSGAHA